MRGLTCLIAAVLFVIAADAGAAEKQYCTPEAYLPESIEKSMKVCDAIIADKRQPDTAKIQAYQNRGDLYLRKQDYEASLRNFDKAVEILGKMKVVRYTGFGGPSLPAGSIDNIAAASIYKSRAWLFVNWKNHTRAIEEYTKALKIHPDGSDTYYSRAKSHEDLGRYDHAIADLSQAIKIAVERKSNPYARDFAARGELYLKTGDFDRALSDLNKALEIEPKFKEAIAGRGKVHLAKGNFDLALADLDVVVAQDKTFSDYRNARGLAYLKKGNLDLALTEINDAITYASSSKAQDRAEYLANRADIYKKQGNWLKALEDYQSSLTIVPSHSRSTTGRDAARLALISPPPAPSSTTVAAVPVPAKPAIINERRVALVVGNSAYVSVPALPNPPRDAATLAQALRNTGFQVVQVATDLTRNGLVEALQSFAAEADRADWAVVYFAGHGIETGGVNYLIPVDARLRADRDVPLEAVALDQVLATVTGAKKLRLVVLDACRDNPFVARMSRTVAGRSVGRGLARIEPEGGTLVAFAAKHGQTALDGAQGGNSPFVSAFVRQLQSPNVEISKMFRLIRDDVLAATGRQQEPFTYGSLPGQDFYFRVQ